MICVIDSLVQILDYSFHHRHTGEMAQWAKQRTYVSDLWAKVRNRNYYIFLIIFFLYFI